MAHPSWLTILLALSACSDYALKGKTTPNPPTQVADSGEPTGMDGGNTSPSDTDSGESPPPNEECNGLDDNEDGAVDEGFPDTDSDGIADCVDGECEPLRSEAPAPEAEPSCVATLPTPGFFDFQEVWSWEAPVGNPDYGHVFDPPIIISLNDDNGDGWVDQDDIPDIVFAHGRSKYEYEAGMVTALSGDGSGELWSYSDGVVSSATELAAGDIDGDGLPEIAVHAAWSYATGAPPQQITVLNADGTLKWVASYLTSRDGMFELTSVGAPSMSDVDGDGKGNILGADRCWDEFSIECGKYETESMAAVNPLPSDLDSDGIMEVVLDGNVMEYDGTAKWSIESLEEHEDGYLQPAIVDMDLDGLPEVLFVDVWGGLFLVRSTGEPVWVRSYSEIETTGVGPNFTQPAIGNIFGDGELGFVVRDWLGGLSAWDSLGELRCALPAVIEHGDGGSWTYSNAPVLYKPSEAMPALAIIRNYVLGEGAVVDLSTCTKVGSIPGAGPVSRHGWGGAFADVDLDGQPELILGFSGYLSTDRKGIAVYRPVEPWAPARRIWNQAQYHQTNINDDGSIPSPETPVWEANNSWREQAWFADWPNLPNLRPLGVDLCFECEGDEFGLSIQVGNAGAGRALARIPVSIYAQAEDSSRTLQGIGYLTTELGAGESASVDITMPTSAWPEGSALVIVVDDNGDGSDRRDECDESDNEWILSDRPCAD